MQIDSNSYEIMLKILNILEDNGFYKCSVNFYKTSISFREANISRSFWVKIPSHRYTYLPAESNALAR